MATDITDPTSTADQPDLELRDRYMREIADHRRLVGKYMAMFATALMQRAINHDLSKFGEFEFEGYVKAYPTFCRADYGSDLYKEACRIAGPALQAHVKGNDHHPEFFECGVEGMHLVQLVEMVMDWMAASMRGAREDDFSHINLPMNFKRFGIEEQLGNIITNTVDVFAEGERLA